MGIGIRVPRTLMDFKGLFTRYINPYEVMHVRVNEQENAPCNHPTCANAWTENRTCSNLVHAFVHVPFRSTQIIRAFC